MLFATIREALANLRSHRRWTALTTFGIVWGTASVVLLVGWGIGIHTMIEAGLQKVGKNLVYVMPGRVGEDLTPAEERRQLFLDMDDVEHLRRSARRVDAMSADIIVWAYARRQSTIRNVNVRGVEPEMRDLRGIRPAAGRFLNPDDLRHQRRVAVLGQRTRERLFGPRPALGQGITLNGQRFTVIGVLEGVGAQLSRDGPLMDEQVFIPATTTRLLTGNEYVSKIVMRPHARELDKEMQREVRALLAERLHVSPTDEEAVFIISMIDFLSGFDTLFKALQVFLFLMAVTTLAIGGIGVMNMMLVAVNERRREIGVRLAVGARRGQVVAQFVAETLVITLCGGFAGLALGLGACLLLRLLPREVFPVPAIVPSIAFVAIAVTTVVGLLAGAVPAWQAARVDPAVSLRTE
jgi:putative ABC transport system permease protein